MSSFGLNTGLRALMSAQFMMDTVGHNISNANVDGYNRQRVTLGASMALARGGNLIGTGVDVMGVNRSVDDILTRRILEQTTITGGLETQLLNLYQVESLFSEPDGVSLGGRLDDFFSSISGLSADPTSPILRTSAVQAGVQISSQLNELSSGLASVTGSLYDELEGQVRRVNQLSQQIGQLNQEITGAIRGGLTPNDLHDQQDRAINELASLVDLQVVSGDGETVRVLAGGTTLVGTNTVQEIESRRLANGEVDFSLKGSDRSLRIQGGTIGGIIDLTKNTTPAMQAELDQLARSLILDFNRIHATGLSSDGAFSSLTSANGFQDQDGDGAVRDELVVDSGLPFDVSGGAFFVNVQNATTGALQRHEIEVDPTRTTVGDLIEQMNAIDNLTVSVDVQGRMEARADNGYGFDFSTRIDEAPDLAGALGGGAASMGASTSGPFALADGDTLDLLTSPGGTPVPVNFVFDANDFEDISEATVDEVAAALNADTGFSSTGMVARVQSGELVLQTTATGSDVSFGVTGGTALGEFGWTGLTGSTVRGSDDASRIELSGTYSGDSNEQWTFQPNMDGVIGTTPGLEVDVYDQAGNLVASLDVGDGYNPGKALTVADGMEISFGLGDLSATNNDKFSTMMLAESDNTDLLASVGMNAFFTGTGARDISVREDIASDSSLFASSGTGKAGDTTQLLKLLSLEGADSDQLEGRTFGAFYGQIVGGLGTDVNIAQTALNSSDSLMAGLEQRRSSISGVNVDEELVDMLRFEQAFTAASRFITTVNQMNDTILNLI